MSIYYVTAAVSNINLNTIGTPNDDGDPYGIQAAFDNSGAGDTVAIKADAIYLITAQLDMDIGGGSLSAGTFKRVIGYSIVLGDGGIPILDGLGGSYHLIYIFRLDNIIIQNIYATNVNTASYDAIYVNSTASESTNILIENCIVSHARRGINVGPKIRNVTCNNITAFANAAFGIIMRATYTGIIRNSIAFDNVWGIQIERGVIENCVSYGNITGFSLSNDFAAITNCTAYNNDYGIRLIGGGGGIIYNTIAWNNSIYDIWDQDGSGTIGGDYNCYGSGNTSGYIIGANDITSDPLFMSETPAIVLDINLILNGDFSNGETNWGGDWIISSGEAHSNQEGDELTYTGLLSALIVGQIYRFDMDFRTDIGDADDSVVMTIGDNEFESAPEYHDQGFNFIHAGAGIFYFEYVPGGYQEDVFVDNISIKPVMPDLRLKPESPCINTGSPTIQSGYTSRGAWQRKSFLGIN